MSVINQALHELIDVATGRKNLPAHDADRLHALIDTGTGPAQQDATAPEAPEAPPSVAEQRAALEAQLAALGPDTPAGE